VRADNRVVLRYALARFPQAIQQEGLLPAIVRWKDSRLVSQMIRSGTPITAAAVRALAVAGELRLLKSVLLGKYRPTSADFEVAVRFGCADRLHEIVEVYLQAGCHASRATFQALATRWASKDNWDIEGQTIFRRLVKLFPVSYQKAIARMVIETLSHPREAPGRHLGADLEWLARYAPKVGDHWRNDSTYSLGAYSLPREHTESAMR